MFINKEPNRALFSAFAAALVISFALFKDRAPTNTVAGQLEVTFRDLTIAPSGSSKSTQFADRREPSEVDLRIRGVGLGSTLDQVRRRFGVPKGRRKEPISDNTCGPPYTHLSLRYAGLSFGLNAPRKGSRFEVVSLEVISSIWTIQPGVRVGMNERLVRSKLGQPTEESDERGFHRLYYVNKGNDGTAVFYFKDGELRKVEWESSLC